MNFYSGSKETLGEVQKAWRSSSFTTDFCFSFTFLSTVKKHK